jgi:hypothetical protein
MNFMFFILNVLREKFWGDVSKATVQLFEVEYTTAVRGSPHSMQLALNRDVINPHDAHILCDPNRAACGFSLSIHRSSRVVNTTISRPNEILAAFIKATLLAECCTTRGGAGDHSLKSLRCKNFGWTGLGQRT